MELMITTCPACDHVYRPAKSKRVQTCPNCAQIEKTGESITETARRKARESMERSRLKSNAEHPIKNRSVKGAKQEREVSATKKKLKSEAMEGGHVQCQGCLKHFGTIDASHIIPISQSSALAADPANITLLCRECHQRFENGTVPQMIELRCFVRDLGYMFRHDNARFWNIHYRLLEEYNERPTPKLERVLGKLEKFET